MRRTLTFCTPLLLVCAACDADGSSPATSTTVCLQTGTWQDAGALSCPRSIETYCGAKLGAVDTCPPSTWSEVIPSLRASCWIFGAQECGRYNVALPGFLCGTAEVNNLIFYYDGDSGALLAGVAQGDLGRSCLGGPSALDPDAIALTHCSPTGWTWCTNVDGGTYSGPDSATAVISGE